MTNEDESALKLETRFPIVMPLKSITKYACLAHSPS